MFAEKGGKKNAILNAFYAPCNEELVLFLLKGSLLTEVGFIEALIKRSLELTPPIPFCPNHADSALMLLSDITLLFWHPIAFLSPRCYFFVIFGFIFGSFFFSFTDPRKIFMILENLFVCSSYVLCKHFMWCLAIFFNIILCVEN